MRAQSRRITREEEEESAFISMTDMTVGFLFIVMILLAFFASQFRENDRDRVPRVEYDRVVRERDEVQTALTVAEKERDELRIQLAQAESELTRLRAELLRIESERDAVRAERDALVQENRELKARIVRLEALIQQLELKIAELEREREDPLEAYLASVAAARQALLVKLRDVLQADFQELGIRDLTVGLSGQNDALRFQGDGLFDVNSASFRPGKETVVRTIARRLNEFLPCYTLGGPPLDRSQCNIQHAIIEAVQIEGHTDASGSYARNTVLSAERATTTFGVMMDEVPMLRAYRNLDEQAVMSFAGYGPDRPIADNSQPQGQAANRRIDLRIIMVTPQSTQQVDEIGARFGRQEGAP